MTMSPEERQARLDFALTSIRNHSRDELGPILDSEVGICALVGDVDGLVQAITNDPDVVTRPISELGWTLLMVASASPLYRNADWRASQLAVVQLLLSSGADVNADAPIPGYPDGRLSALYVASGVARDAELVKLLLAAGANPDDGESLYHAVEVPDLDLIGALIDAGAPINQRNVMHHAMDIESEPLVRHLLERGGDANDWSSSQHNTPFHFAIRRGRSVAVVETLVEFGADPQKLDSHGRSGTGLAAIMGRGDILDMLTRRGIEFALNDVERAVLEGKRPEGDLPADVAHLLPDAAANGDLYHVNRLLSAGWDVNVKGTHGGTPLHWASWHGHPEVVRAILAYHPDLTVRDSAFGADVMGWASHGSKNTPVEATRYAEVIEALALAGVPMNLDPESHAPSIREVIQRFAIA